MAVGTAKVVLVVGHTLFWALVIARMLVSRRQSTRTPDEPGGAATTVVSRRARSAILWAAFTMVAYYVILVAWWLKPELAGPNVLPTAAWLGWFGAALMGLGVAIIGWAYLVFDSFRFLAAAGPGHTLCTRGPFAWLRHPIYSGILLLYIGSFFAVPRLAFGIQALANAVAYNYRARTEEDLLVEVFAPEYQRYAERTHRFIPGVY